jgi:hypothetical protein
MLKQFGLSVIHFNTVLKKKDKSQVSENRVLREMSRAKTGRRMWTRDAIAQRQTFINTIEQFALRFGSKIRETEPSSSDCGT